MSNNINPENLVKKADSLFGGSPVILFLGAGHKIQQYPELLSKPWSGIVTSSRDPSLSELFVKNNPRDIDSPSNVREKIVFNRRQLPIIYLNGKTDEAGTNEGYDEEIQRKETRDILLAEFARAASNTFSTIFFTEYNKDIPYEIDPDILYRHFRNINHQLLWFFNVDESIKAFKVLVSKEIAVSYQFNIGDLFQKYGDEYTDDFNEELLIRTESYENSHFYIDGKIEPIVESETRAFLPYGQLLSVSHMEASKVGYNLITEWFYKFLKESCSEPQWYGYDPRWHFNFNRDFEKKMLATVYNDIEKEQEKPIVLCGQTCSGKSIALASLAWHLFHDKKLPIVYIQKQNLPVKADSEWIIALEILINALNARSAKQIILIWDASIYNLTRENHLSKLQTIFKNKGKKIIIIASAMEQRPDEVKEIKTLYNVQPVSVELSDKERKSLKNLLVEKGKIPRDSLEKWFSRNEQQENLLALLYKLVFQIHPELELSLKDEINACIKDTSKTLEEMPSRELIFYEPTAIGLQLQKLGLIPKPDTDHNYAKTTDWKEMLDNFYRMLAVCSQFNLNVPVTLASRYFGIDDTNCRKIIFNAPSFKFYEDTEFHPGEYAMSFRTSVEADIYLTKVNPKEQYEIIAGMIRMISQDFYSSDVDFIVKVLQAAGPNSEFDKIPLSYEYFTIIIDALKELRNKDVFEPGLIIQEVVYIREYYGPANKYAGKVENEIRIKQLREAIELSKSSLDKMKKNLYEKSAEHSLSVEYIFGWLALRQICKDEHVELPLELSFDEAYILIKDVIYENPNSSFPYVALIQLINSKSDDTESSNKREKIFSDMGLILDLIDDVDTDYPEVAQNERFMSARNRFNQNLDGFFNSQYAQTYCDDLLKKGSPVGLYLKVFNLLRKNKIDLNKKPADNNQLKICREAIDLLENDKYLDISISHPRCRYTLLRLKYLYYNKAPMISYPNERQRACLSKSQWKEIYDLAAYVSDNIFPNNPRLPYKNIIYYMQALASAHLERYSIAEEIFNKINSKKNEVTFFTPIRIKTFHLLCDEHGNLRDFKGRFKKTEMSEKESGYLQVAGFGKGVFYSSKNFLLATGTESVIDNLCIGMSFVGFVAYNKAHNIITGKR